MLLRGCLIVLFSVSSLFGYSQNVPVAIQALAKSKKEGVWLRWAPSNATMWTLGNKHGYTIERFTLKPDGELENPSGEKLTSVPLKPISQAGFEKLSNEVPEASVVEELIYGEDAIKTYSENSPASVLVRNREMENQFGISLLMCDLSRRVAEAAGLFLHDATAIKGKKYIYRISLAFQPKGSVFEPGVIIVDVTDEKPLLEIKDVNAEFGDGKASISWSTLLHRGIYSAYYIEKSVDGKTFTKLSDLPYVHMSESLDAENAFYVDSLDANNKTFYYRIIGITPFAESGPASNVVSGSGKDNLSGFLVLREAKADPEKKVSLKWEFPAEAEKQIFGFIVSRSNLPSGPFKDVNNTPLTKNVREFIDATTFYNTYYIVKAVDNTGKELSRSFPFLVQVEDTTPPAVPVGLKGSIDKQGQVIITWNANTDADLLGYRVFRSNRPDEEFVEVTKSILTTPSFLDSIQIEVLNKKIYYNIVAVDKNYNPSEYSQYLTLNKPDIVAPAAPVFIQAEVKGGKINLAWTNSPSDDVARLELTRIEKEERTTRPIVSWKLQLLADKYIEPSLPVGKTYQYKLTVFDSAGNYSEAFSPDVFYETGIRDAVTGLKASADQEGKKVAVSWKNPLPAVKCFIYRKKNDDPFTLYQTLDGNIENFTDKWVVPNFTYSYKVQLGYPKGVKSEISSEVATDH